MRRRLSLAEWLDYLAARMYVTSKLTLPERQALRGVRIIASADQTNRRGFFHGVQARRNPDYTNRLARGAEASGLVTIFVRSHPPGDLHELAVTIHHEIDHALGFGEGGVLSLAAARHIAEADVLAYRVRLEGFRLVVPAASGPPPEPPAKRHPVLA